MQVRPERSHWRDAALSERHRAWGWDCPMLDIDFLVAEYDHHEPVAIIEYKHEKAPEQKITNSSYRVLKSLGDRAGLPVFAVRYAENFSWYLIVCINDLGREFLQQWVKADEIKRIKVSEKEYVQFLYFLRKSVS